MLRSLRECTWLGAHSEDFRWRLSRLLARSMRKLPTSRALQTLVNDHVKYEKSGVMEMYTVPENMWPVLAKGLPPLNDAMYRAVVELALLDELVAYRIMTTKIEILVVADREFAAAVVHRVKSKRKKKKPQEANK